MSIKTALGLADEKKIRYAIIALGDISQDSMMPGVGHTGNSVITALVTGDPAKAAEVARQYNVPPENVYGYEQFHTLVQSGKVDAMYIATPNWRHAEFAVPALKAGIHVLLEKPMEMTVAKCQEIIDAATAGNAKLMIAYRLHFEPATLAIIDLLRAGEIGHLRSFSANFAQLVKPNNHRVQNGIAAGPLYDMGVYPINAARYCLEAEPTEVFAFATRSADAGLPMDLDHTVTVLMKFPAERVAQFVVSYVADAIDEFTLTGSEGTIRQTPAFGMTESHEYELTKSGKKTSKSFKLTDHFGGELQYFSQRILDNITPEPDGEEGLLDVRIVEAIVQSLKMGTPVKLEPMRRSKRIDTAGQVEKLGAVKPKELVNTEKPGK